MGGNGTVRAEAGKHKFTKSRQRNSEPGARAVTVRFAPKPESRNLEKSRQKNSEPGILGGNGAVRAGAGKERKLCRAVVGAGYTRPGASCGCRGVAGRRVRRPYEPNTGRQCPTSVPVIRRAGIHPRRPENPLPGCRHHAHHPTTQSPLPHFGCKGRAGKFQRKIPRRGFPCGGFLFRILLVLFL